MKHNLELFYPYAKYLAKRKLNRHWGWHAQYFTTFENSTNM